jgi:hypothetical protein
MEDSGELFNETIYSSYTTQYHGYTVHLKLRSEYLK